MTKVSLKQEAITGMVDALKLIKDLEFEARAANDDARVAELMALQLRLWNARERVEKS